MKLAVVALLALTDLAHSRSVDYEDIPDIFSPYGYLENYGVPLANSIREVEEAELAKNPRIVVGVVSGNGQIPYQTLSSPSRYLWEPSCVKTSLGREQSLQVLVGQEMVIVRYLDCLVLHHVQVDVISNEVCARAPNFARAIHTSTLCISGAGGRNMCHGDSGGPLAITRNNRPVLIGVTSFGNNAGCQAGFPAVFARLTYFDS